MVDAVTHNPDRYMADFRQLLTQGNKRIGLMIGAGAPASIMIKHEHGEEAPLIPTIKGLTEHVMSQLPPEDTNQITKMMPELGDGANIEQLLTKLRLLNQALGGFELNGITGAAYNALANRICQVIGARVGVSLPVGESPYSHLVSWISGISRIYAIELFTPNYDLLIEEALERANCPFFDGFSGGISPFFDTATIANDDLPSRWTRVWKMHGSLGWELVNDRVVRTQSRTATQLIYPDHLKYNDTQKQPYTALFDRLKSFIRYPDTLLVTCGFSFADAHISSAIEEALAANPTSAVIALQYSPLEQEKYAKAIALRRPNLSVYAADAAIISGVLGQWNPGTPPNDAWLAIRKTFWSGTSTNGPSKFLLGDFAALARFLALSGSENITPQINTTSSQEAKNSDAETQAKAPSNG